MNVKSNRMNISVMRQILQGMEYKGDRNFYMNEDFGISYESNLFFQRVLSNRLQTPFLVEDYRIGIVINGQMEATVNLMHRKVAAGNMIYIGRGSIAQVNSISPELTVRGFIISNNLMSRIFDHNRPDIIDGTVLSHVFDADARDMEFLCDVNTAVWHLIHSQHYHERSLYGLLSSALYYMDARYKQAESRQTAQDGNNHNYGIFNRFITLVNQNAARERSIGFYADRLCFSPRYLSTVISQHSGQTAKEWIDQAAINQAKVLLLHTDKSISQISDELNFPNDSFFCKYFRRLTGQSPSAYRDSK